MYIQKHIWKISLLINLSINSERNGTNINDNCGSTHIEVLQQFVKEKGLDIGFAYDGDADRCLAVDDKGELIDGDLILYICGCYMKEKGEFRNNTIVTTVMSNFGLYKALDKKGIYYEKTAVGDKYVFDREYTKFTKSIDFKRSWLWTK